MFNACDHDWLCVLVLGMIRIVQCWWIVMRVGLVVQKVFV